VEPAPPARRVVLEYVEDLFQHAMLLLIAYRSIGCRAQAKVPPPGHVHQPGGHAQAVAGTTQAGQAEIRIPIRAASEIVPTEMAVPRAWPVVR